MTKILVLTLDGTGERQELAAGTLAVGRAHQGNGWILIDPGPTPTVSRWHCRFAVDTGGASVTDLESTNGTRVDGQTLVPHRPTPLRGGEVVEIGARRIFVDTVEQRSFRDPGPTPLSPPAHGPAPGDWLGPNAPLSVGWPPGQEEPVPAAPGVQTGDSSFPDLSQEKEPLLPLRNPGGNDPLGPLFGDSLLSLRRDSAQTPVPGRPVTTGAPQGQAMPTSHRRPSHTRAETPAAPPSATARGTFDPLGPFAGAPPARARRPAPDPEPSSQPPASVPDPVEDDDPFSLAPARARSSEPAPPRPQNSNTSPEPADEGEQRPDASVPPAAVPPSAAGVSGDAQSQQDDPSGAALLAAFLDGAGLEATTADGRSPEAFFREAGQVFARLADGLRELLAVRAVVKDHARLDRTRISAARNNPLKLSINGREATAALLSGGEEGYLGPLAAVDAGLRDLKAHELAILEGVQSAVEEMLELFDPAPLERRLDAAGMLATLIQGGRRARLWELYQERYGEIAGAARSRFMGRLDEAFRSAYARKAAEVSALPASPADPSPSPGAARQ